MTWVVVVLKGPAYNETMAGIRFAKWGEFTDYPYIACDTWAEGFKAAREKGYTQALFVKSGSLFPDWYAWRDLINNYPHQGLIGHIIWHPDQEPYIDDQCWFLDLTRFDIQDLEHKSTISAGLIRSDENLHDDYTPLWLRPSTGEQTYSGSFFGQGLITRQINEKRIVSNWSKNARDLKFYCYPDMDLAMLIRERFAEYLAMAENQLWVLNNEPPYLSRRKNFITPGSGINWILNLLNPATESVTIIDISQSQIKFCQDLLDQWDGLSYGKFAYEFITNNKLKHFELDQAGMSAVDRLKYRNADRFIEYVDHRFRDTMLVHGISDWQSAWYQCRRNKNVQVIRDNLVDYMIDNDLDFKDLWASNVLYYKWTKLHTTWDKWKIFRARLNEAQHQSIDAQTVSASTISS